VTRRNDINPGVLEDMKKKNIDIDLTLSILNKINSKGNQTEPAEVSAIPNIDNETILDFSGNSPWTADLKRTVHEADKLGIGKMVMGLAECTEGEMKLSRQALSEIGRELYLFTSYGILNGGSASSYADKTKNKSFNSDIYSIYEARFNQLSDPLRGRPKGATPAFIQHDGSAGPSFIELKMRALLIETFKYLDTGKICRRGAPSSGVDVLFPMFQMLSQNNKSEIEKTYKEYRHSSLLEELIRFLEIDITQTRDGIQPLIAAFTHSEPGTAYGIFDRADGKQNSVIALPGGHGQCFSVLRPIFEDLYSKGKRFIQICNVDNIGNSIDPAELAILALSGKQAGFDFAFRTPVDIKGGILIRDSSNRLTCVDIGPAVTKEDVLRFESAGHRILFNCATGLFNLEYLVNNIDHITDSIPLRLSDQNKDAGKYSQAEYITWEVIGILDEPLIFGVDKYDRFLAAKLLLESLMTSGLDIESPSFPISDTPEEDLKHVAEKLHSGLKEKLSTVYGMKRNTGRWIPKTILELHG
jgi:UTP--glucose-1-phosphate uridylyltransferase